MQPLTRLRSVSGPVLLGLALAVSACSSDRPAERIAAEIDTPVPTTDGTPTSEVGAPDALDDYLTELELDGFVGSIAVRSPAGDWNAGFGSADRSADIDNEADTIFDIASITKQFTAAAILRLEMDGQLSVDDRVGQYLVGLNAEQSEITLHQLLTHTAGLPDALGPDDEAIDLPGFIARLASTPPVSAPGGEYLYSNVGYSLLGAVVEAVSGESYEVYLRTALFEPAGMAHTGYVLPDWNDATIAVGYDGDEVFGRPDEQPWDTDGPWWNLRANGGLLSSVTDLLRWDEALRGDEILDADAKEKMYTPHVAIGDAADTFSGYAWAVVPITEDTTLITHQGFTGVFYADLLRFLEDDITIAVATNAFDPTVADVGSGIADRLLPDLFDDDDGVCELDQPTLDAISAFDVVVDPSATPAAQAMSDWIAVVVSGPADESEVRSYVERSLGHGFVDELGTETVMVIVQQLQATYRGFVVDRIHREDDTTFHAVVVDADGIEVVMSARIGDAPEWRVDCLGFPS